MKKFEDRNMTREAFLKEASEFGTLAKQYPKLLIIMDEYAKQKSIAFISWYTSENYWFNGNGFILSDENELNQKALTIQELYELFLKETK